MTTLALLLAAALPAAEPTPKLLDVRMIWDKAPHNAFTDLIRVDNRWFCSFREASSHVKGAGTIRVLTSENGQDWISAATLEAPNVDLRDPKLSRMPDGRLLMVGGAAVPPSRDPLTDHYSFVSFSKDGKEWSAPEKILDSWQWLWRLTWHKGTAYGVAYSWDPKETNKSYRGSLYRTTDGRHFTRAAEFNLPNTTEGSVAFVGDTMYCLQRRDGKPNTAQLGMSQSPYSDWTWKDLGVFFGGPQLIQIEGHWWAVGRFMEKGKPQTVLCRLDLEQAKLEPKLTLPSGGDTSYPGLVWHNGVLWISYYSSHEGKSKIYLARVALTAR